MKKVLAVVLVTAILLCGMCAAFGAPQAPAQLLAQEQVIAQGSAPEQILAQEQLIAQEQVLAPWSGLQPRVNIYDFDFDTVDHLIFDDIDGWYTAGAIGVVEVISVDESNVASVMEKVLTERMFDMYRTDGVFVFGDDVFDTPFNRITYANGILTVDYNKAALLRLNSGSTGSMHTYYQIQRTVFSCSLINTFEELIDGYTSDVEEGMVDHYGFFPQERTDKHYAFVIEGLTGAPLESIEGPKGLILMRIGYETMYVNGIAAEIDPGRGTVPVLKNARTLLPIRAVVESMGGEIGWDENESRVDISAFGHKIQLWIGRNEIIANGKHVNIDVAPETINSRTMLPIRFVAEYTGCLVGWIEQTEEVFVIYPLKD